MPRPPEAMNRLQLRALVLRMEDMERAVTLAGDYKLAFVIQQELIKLAFMIHPEWNKRSVQVTPTNGKKSGRKIMPEPEVEPEVPEEKLEDMRELSDEELEKSLGLR